MRVRIGCQQLEGKIVDLAGYGEGHRDLPDITDLIVRPPVKNKAGLHVDIGGGTGPAVKEGGRENRYQYEFFHVIQSSWRSVYHCCGLEIGELQHPPGVPTGPKISVFVLMLPDGSTALMTK